MPTDPDNNARRGLPFTPAIKLLGRWSSKVIGQARKALAATSYPTKVDLAGIGLMVLIGAVKAGEMLMSPDTFAGPHRGANMLELGVASAPAVFALGWAGLNRKSAPRQAIESLRSAAGPRVPAAASLDASG